MYVAFTCLSFMSMALLACRSSLAQSEPASLATDRPSIAAGTDVAAPSWMIVENGFSFHVSSTSYSVDGTESLVRYGLGRGLELRWTTPVVTRSSTSSEMARGDGNLAFKARLPSWKAWPVAAIAGYSVPLATRGQGSGAWDPTLLLTCSHGWNPRLFTVATYNLYWTSSPSAPRSRSQQYALEMGWNASRTTTAYIEEAPLSSSESTQAGYTADAGVLWMRRPTTQWDIHVGLTKAGTARQVVGGVGLSFMFSSHSQRRL